jgi:hypothetical protein
MFYSQLQASWYFVNFYRDDIDIAYLTKLFEKYDNSKFLDIRNKVLRD